MEIGKERTVCSIELKSSTAIGNYCPLIDDIWADNKWPQWTVTRFDATRCSIGDGDGDGDGDGGGGGGTTAASWASFTKD